MGVVIYHECLERCDHYNHDLNRYFLRLWFHLFFPPPHPFHSPEHSVKSSKRIMVIICPTNAFHVVYGILRPCLRHQCTEIHVFSVIRFSLGVRSFIGIFFLERYAILMFVYLNKIFNKFVVLENSSKVVEEFVYLIRKNIYIIQYCCILFEAV